MKKIISLVFYLVLPFMALAQVTDDGHNHVHGEIATSTQADPEQRIYVMIGVGVVFAIMIGWFVWSKMKSTK